jgi:hypothetical protein
VYIGSPSHTDCLNHTVFTKECLQTSKDYNTNPTMTPESITLLAAVTLYRNFDASRLEHCDCTLGVEPYKRCWVVMPPPLHTPSPR